MFGIPSEIYHELKSTLLRCGPFTNDSEIRAIFADARLSMWHNDLPTANTPAKRVQAIVSTLREKYNHKGENALVLLLRVLAAQMSPADACHRDLLQLASELEKVMKSSCPHLEEDILEEERASLKHQLASHRRNLYRLQEQKAKYGILVPLAISNQMDEEEWEIKRLRAKLESLEA